MYGDIGWDVTAKQVAEDLRALGTIKKLRAWIQSGGGDVIDGMAIYNIIARLPAEKTIYVETIAASMASVICMAFQKIIMPSNAFMMIHSPWGGVGGTAEEIREYADVLDRWKGSMAKAYKDKTSQSDDIVAEWMSKDTWFNAEEAKAVGLCDEIVEPLQMAASIDPKRLQEYENMPEKLKALFAPQGNVGATTQQPAAAVTAQNQQSATATTTLATSTQLNVAQPTQEQINAAAAAMNKARVDGLNTLFASWPQFADLRNECIADVEMNAEKAKDKILAKLGEGTAPAAALPTRVIVHAGNGNIVGDSIRAQLMARAGHAEAEKDNGYASYSMRELARASLADRGIGISGMAMPIIVGLAFTHSSSDFGEILIDVANKSVAKGWDTADETFEKWTRKGQQSDFKPGKLVGMGDFNSLRQVREGAEYKYATIGGTSESIVLATYGELFSITRQAIINDDLNQLTRIPEKFGRAAKGTIGDLVYAILTSNIKMADGKSLFHADHHNLGSGGADIASLSAGRTAMRSQKSGNRHLNIRPAFLLSPVSLEDTFNQIIKSVSVKGADANSGIANPIKDFVEVIGEPRLDEASATEWYLAAAQGEDTIEVDYLEGMDTPYIEQQQGFTQDGVVTKVRIDAGVAPVDSRGMYKSTGV